ncbi:hypothetical protein Cni_G02026 [Canna indica]|uniref:Uncharacterized protein n=1 Tax=Canna indica TaxID=4628 RepID=A0AAQ3JQJ5_9LILI|nr:hypothetical protein Cni_G02026 [Canna indica]
MGICYGKPELPEVREPTTSPPSEKKKPEAEADPRAQPFLLQEITLRSIRRGWVGDGHPEEVPFPPPSMAKHIRAVLARRHGSVKPNEAAIPEDEGEEGRDGAGLDKNFGFLKGFASKYEIGEEVGRGHFGYTCTAKTKKGDGKDQPVPVKVIPKAKVKQILSFLQDLPVYCFLIANFTALIFVFSPDA